MKRLLLALGMMVAGSMAGTMAVQAQVTLGLPTYGGSGCRRVPYRRL